MTTIVKTVLTASSLAALAVWLKHAYAGARSGKLLQEEDEFAGLLPAAPETVEIDDDIAADIIRRARPALERARKV